MSLQRSWNALIKHPWIVLFPVVWDLGSWLITLLLGDQPVQEAGKVTAKFLLPPTMPSGGELLGGGTIGSPSLGALALVLGLLLIGSFIKAGYLHVMTGALQGEETGWARFAEGAKYYGGRMLLWHLIVGGLMVVATLLAIPLRSGILLLLPVMLAAFAFYLTDFLIVARDMEVGEALQAAPGMLAANFGQLLPVGLVSVALSAALSLGLSGLGLTTIWAAAPLWAWFGTWTGMAVLAVLEKPVPDIE